MAMYEIRTECDLLKPEKLAEEKVYHVKQGDTMAYKWYITIKRGGVAQTPSGGNVLLKHTAPGGSDFSYGSVNGKIDGGKIYAQITTSVIQKKGIVKCRLLYNESGDTCMTCGEIKLVVE